MTGKTVTKFFPSIPNGVFNLASIFLDLKEFGRLHQVLPSNKQCNAHWECRLRQDAHHAKPLFDIFTSKESLHSVLFVRHIDVRGWELRLSDPKSSLESYQVLVPR